MWSWVLGILFGGACLAVATWAALPRDRRLPFFAPKPFEVVGFAVFSACFLAIFCRLIPVPIGRFGLEVSCAMLAAPGAVLVFGMLVSQRHQVGFSGPPANPLLWTLVAAGIAGLWIATVGVCVFLPLLGITAYAGVHVVTFARFQRTPALERAMTSTSFGLTLFWLSLPATHVDLPNGPEAWSAWSESGGSYMPGSRTGFPFQRIVGAANASAREFLPLDRGLPWMLLDAACCIALGWLGLWPVPRVAFRPLVVPALVASCAATLVGVAYMTVILD